MRYFLTLAGVSSALSLLSTPIAAHAQSATAPGDSVFNGDYLMVGVGAIYGPSYEGSDDYVASPVPVISGKISGIEITPRPGGVALDLIPDNRTTKTGFSIGPVATYSSNRKHQIEDSVVRSAGKLKAALELGVNGGVTVYKLLSPYDSVTVSADVKWDVNGAHGGMTVSPGVSYVTPLNRAAFVTVRVGAKHVDDDYADYYFSVSPAQGTASELPTFQAKGGWTSASVSTLLAYDLDGNALNGGAAVFLLGSYNRLMNDAKRTPYTALRGDADQWLVGAGLTYTF